jgi:DNA-binding transcriptional LysR family regulator
MELQQLRHFLVTVRHGHMGKAAAELNLSQSGLTRSIQNLERSVNARLLKRAARGVEVTEFGHELKRHAEAITSQHDKALESMATLQTTGFGIVRLGITRNYNHYFIPDVLANLLKRNPGLRLQTVSGTYLDLVDRLRSGELDLVVGLIDPTYQQRDITAEDLLETRSAIVCPVSHPLVGKADVTPQELAQAQWILPSGRGIQNAFEGYFTANRCPLPDQIMSSSSLVLILKVLEHLNALTILPRDLVAGAVGDRKLTIIETETPADYARAGITRRADEPLNRAATTVVEHIRAAAQEKISNAA